MDGFGFLPSVPPSTTRPSWGTLPPAATMAMPPGTMAPPVMPTIPQPAGAQPAGLTPAGMPQAATPAPGVPQNPGEVSPLAAVLAGLSGGAVGPQAARAAQLPAAQQADVLSPADQAMEMGGGGMSPSDTLAALLTGSMV